MKAPSQQHLIDRYEPKIRSELIELLAASGLSKADRAPVALDQQSVGRLSRMDAMQVQAMSKAAEVRRVTRIRQLQYTLDRLLIQDFGHCIACGEFIGLARLDIDPASVRCAGCAK